MPVYQLFGKNLNISQGMLNYSELIYKFQTISDEAERTFKNSYKQSYPSQSDYSVKTNRYAMEAFTIATRAYGAMLRDQKIYTVNALNLCNNYSQIISDAVSDIVDSINDVNQSAQVEKEYRAERKANRSRASGIGFGISGYLKASANAAAINAATGLGHSMFNAIGNAGTSIAAGANIGSIIRSNDTIQYIADAIQTAISKVHTESMGLLMDAGLDFECVKNPDQSCNIMNQIDSIPEEDRKTALLQALDLCYLNDSAYSYIVRHYPEESRTADEIATSLHIDVSDPIKNRINFQLGVISDSMRHLDNQLFYPYNAVKMIFDDFDEAQKAVEDTGWNVNLIQQRISLYEAVKKSVEHLPHDFLSHNFNDKDELLTCLQELEIFYQDMRNKNLGDEVEFSNCLIELDKYENLNLYHYDFLEERLNFLKNLKGDKVVEELTKIVTNSQFAGSFESRIKSPKFEKRVAQIAKYIPLNDGENVLLVFYPALNEGIAFTNERVIGFDHMLAKKQCYVSTYSASRFFCNKNNAISVSGTGLVGTQEFEIPTNTKEPSESNDFTYLINEILEILQYRCTKQNDPATTKNKVFEKADSSKNSESGSMLTLDEAPIEKTPEVKKSVVNDTMFCTTCGNKIQRSAKFCTFCGNVMQAQKMETMFCTGCGKKILRTTKFCTYCGTQNTYRKERGV